VAFFFNYYEYFLSRRHCIAIFLIKKNAPIAIKIINSTYRVDSLRIYSVYVYIYMYVCIYIVSIYLKSQKSDYAVSFRS